LDTLCQWRDIVDSYLAKSWRCAGLKDGLELVGCAKAAWSPRTNSTAPILLSTPFAALTG